MSERKISLGPTIAQQDAAMKRIRERQITDALLTEGAQKIDEQRAELARLRAHVAALEADKAALTTALYECETVMMIVAPRSHKDEYLATLSAVRLNLAAHGTKP